jgi:hypothetical protein
MGDFPDIDSEQPSAAEDYAAEDARLVKAVEDAQRAYIAKAGRKTQ